MAESIEVIQRKDAKENTRKTNSIILTSYVGTILSCIAFIIAGGVFYTSPTLTPDKRVFFASILAVVAIGLQIIVFVVRSDPVYLNFFTLLSVAVSFLSVGFSVSFL